VRAAPLAAVSLACLAAVGCRQTMDTDPKYEAMEPSSFFSDGRSARAPVAGTVARGELKLDTAYYEGRNGDSFVGTFPAPVTKATLLRGRQRYDIFCSPCHGLLGDGNGVVVQRGLRGPVNFHEDRLKRTPVGYYFQVITNGRGGMYPYGYRIPPDDRWAIIAYIRALQLSQDATLNDVPPAARAGLNASHGESGVER